MIDLDALHPIVHEPTIRAQLTGALPLPAIGGVQVLLNMIFAMGAFDTATDESMPDGTQYFETARMHLQQEFFAEGSLVLVQGLAIMALYLQRHNRPNTGYICLGLAIRMAVALGMHAPAYAGDSNVLGPLEMEIRNRVWWCLVTLEAGMSLTYGRPHGISTSSLNAVQLPVNTEDEHLTVSSVVLPESSPDVTCYTALITQAQLAQALFSSLDRISRSHPYPTVEQVKWCGKNFRDRIDEIPAMRLDAPPAYCLAHAIQTWRARDYRSVIYRPVFLSAVWSVGMTAIADGCVNEIVK